MLRDHRKMPGVNAQNAASCAHHERHRHASVAAPNGGSERAMSGAFPGQHGRVVPRYLSWPRSVPAVPVLLRRGTGRPPGLRWMRLGEVVCQS